MENIDAVIRIQTDNVVFNENMDSLLVKYKQLTKEDKTTGLINWKNVNKYEKL